MDLNWLWRLFGIRPTLPINDVPNSQFVLQHSPNMNPGLLSSGTSWHFTFPDKDGVHYCVRKVSTALQGAVYYDYRVLYASGLPTFQASAANDTPPCFVRLFIQRYGDDLSGQGAYEHYRWFSDPLPLNSTSGVYAFDPAKWYSVFGKRGNFAVQQFRDALADVEYIGMTFGGKSFAGHGVYVTGGIAAFSIDHYGVS